MKYLIKKLVPVLVSLHLLSAAHAQADPHFTQYYIYPMWLNPALAGAMDGDYRVSAIYRNQWQNITNPFSTIGLSADMATDKNISLGLSLFNQTAGDGGYRMTNGHLSVAYTGIRLDAEGYRRLALGVQGGFLSRRFDPSRFKFGDQWFPGIGYDPTSVTADELSRVASSAFDAGAGLAYYDSDPDKKISPFGGVSVSHLTRPVDPFLAGDKQRLPVRYSLHAGTRIILSDLLTAVPNILYMQQGNAQEKMLGAYMQLSVNPGTELLFGANWRIQDAVAPFVGLYYNNFTVGASYDVNASALGKAVSGTRSFELSLTYTGKRKERVRTDYFKCPRL